MLKLAAIDSIQGIEYDKKNLGKGVSISVSQSVRGCADNLEFNSEASGLCMVFNYGNPVSIRHEDHTMHLRYNECNVLGVVSGQLALSMEKQGSHLAYFVFLQSDVSSSLLGHFSTFLDGWNLSGRPKGKLFAHNPYINAEISHNLRQLESEDMVSDGAVGRVYGRLLVILSQLFSQNGANRNLVERKDAVVNDEKMARMHQVERIIRTDFGTSYTLKELAKLSGTNECYLKQDFKATFGLPVQAYQKKVKMDLAHDMLLNTAKSISAISKLLGYKYVTHFNAAFKRYHGETPGNVRAGAVYRTD